MMADMADAEDYAPMINDTPGGWNRAMGLTVLRATADEVVAELEVGPEHRQPYGIVHGGVHAGVIETVCSIGAAINAMPDGRPVVGLENHTSFLRAVRDGKLTVRATPISRGRRSHVWEGQVRDEADRLVATGRVRLLCLEPEAELAGEKVQRKG